MGIESSVSPLYANASSSLVRQSSQAAFPFLRPRYFRIQSREVIVDGAFRFRGGFLQDPQGQSCLPSPPECAIVRSKYEACDLQAHPYTPLVLVRVGRSPVRCSLTKPNNLED
jgi:hypothetical protein